MATNDATVWLYQLSSTSDWDQNSYRLEVAEGERVSWPVGKRQASRTPVPGERVVCWWAKTNSPEYGVIGWGVIDGATYGEGLRWHPYPPSNRWAISPITSPDVEKAIDLVRGKFKQQTLFLATGAVALSLLAAIRAADQ